MNGIPKAQVALSVDRNILFCPTISPKQKCVQVTVLEDQENQQLFTFEQHVVAEISSVKQCLLFVKILYCSSMC